METALATTYMVATLDKSPITAKGIEVFRAGLQTDSDGNTKVWTIPELDEIVEAYNDAVAASHKAPAIPAPIQIGHEDDQFQKHGSYGWVEKAYRQGDTVLVDYTKVDPSFAEMVNNGTYLHRSVSFYPREHPGNPTPGRLNLRHVAYVRYPAIKGLKEHSFSEFSEAGSGYFNFSFPSQETLDYATVGVSVFNALGAIANLMARQRERVIEMEGLERANEDFPEELIDMIRTEAAKPPENFAPVSSLEALFIQVSDLSAQLNGLTTVVQSLLSQPSASNTDNYPQYSDSPTVSTSPSESSLPPAIAQQFQEMQAQIQALKTDLSSSQSRVRELENLNAQKERQNELAGVADFVETAIAKRKVLPADRAKTINFIMKLSNDVCDGLDFSEGDEEIKKSPRQVYLDEISSRPPLWSDSPMPSLTESGQNFFSEADLAAKAQTLQQEYRAKGVHKALSECIDLVESGRTTA